jgi:hypothetical protein
MRKGKGKGVRERKNERRKEERKEGTKKTRPDLVCVRMQLIRKGGRGGRRGRGERDVGELINIFFEFFHFPSSQFPVPTFKCQFGWLGSYLQESKKRTKKKKTAFLRPVFCVHCTAAPAPAPCLVV